MSFDIERRGEHLLGLAKGIDRAHRDRLSRGEVEIDVELDLHGLGEPDARSLVRAAVEDAYQEGDRCLLVIHGRGRGSEFGSVLREGLPEWLTAPPAGRRVMAFATALPRDGGPGASYVLLRRKRSR
ncbi:MAG: Smr/MutS family protein [Deltaproteobacteria bacterium]|nr:Smr/MutS family protein [Deltaproteobacteria bacterium]MBW2395564.1 Smr/MutS family protein [Deltaproteobacteria bacterium]